jgi:hypothetical protein
MTQMQATRISTDKEKNQRKSALENPLYPRSNNNGTPRFHNRTLMTRMQAARIEHGLKYTIWNFYTKT